MATPAVPLLTALVLFLAPAGPSAISGHPAAAVGGYVDAVHIAHDTLRPRARAHAARSRRSAMPVGAVIEGFLSPRGLPPKAGRLAVTDSGLVFRSADSGMESAYPLVGPVRQAGGRRWRASAVSLAYVDQDRGRVVYLFRVDGGVFETEAPGPLLEVVDRPRWLDSLGSWEWAAERTLVNPADSSAIRSATEGIATGSYADTLYALFGRPRRAAGLVGERGRSAGRLGEYVAARDSMALDPGRMISADQLRHAMAHELGHRWQTQAPAQIATLWQDVAPIRDPKRYGYRSTTEHQAEAIAFAVHFLQTTAGAAPEEGSLLLLDHYELLVPGTSLLARYLTLQPIYARHPLRRLLTTGRQQ
ncbi:MAG: hypothetical protein H0T44_05225 [Gemmatimonadales bacterium]|nr:hypothetical protein [Gemmatimonadales bacterium]